MKIKEGSRVAFDYKLTVDGNEVDSSSKNGPLNYTHGEGKIIPGLTKELEGMQKGEEKTVSVRPEEAYGEVDPQACREVPRSQIPSGIEPKPGMLLQVQSPDGQSVPVRVAKVEPETVLIDFNHPLAGKTLVFDVKIVSVE